MEDSSDVVATMVDGPASDSGELGVRLVLGCKTVGDADGEYVACCCSVGEVEVPGLGVEDPGSRWSPLGSNFTLCCSSRPLLVFRILTNQSTTH